MDKLIAYLCLLLIGGCQTKSNIDYYEEAYNYLDKLENNSISISDTIIPLSFSTFYMEISNGDNPEKVLFELDSIDNQRKFSLYKFTDLSKLQNKPDADLKLYFSETYGNMLIAELVRYTDSKNLSYENIISFNSSRQYLFIFDNDKKIIKVYTKTIQYD